MKPTQCTLTILNQFKSFAQKHFELGNIELFEEAHKRQFNNDLMMTFVYEGYTEMKLTHTLDFTIMYDRGSDLYNWSFSLQNNKTKEAKIAELEEMFADQLKSMDFLIDYAFRIQCK